MEQATKIYKVSIGVKLQGQSPNSNEVEQEIPINNVQIQKTFDFDDHNSIATIELVKMAVCSSAFANTKLCVCMFSLCGKTKNSYKLLSNEENTKLSGFNITQLFMIKIKNQCDCGNSKYLGRYKFDIIKKLKQSDDEMSKLLQAKTELTIRNRNLMEDNKRKDQEILQMKRKLKMKKMDELKDLEEPQLENFYDIIVNINSIKSLNQGWDVKFNENGKQKYEEYKDKELVTIGVIGNINTGKTYLLSKIAKIDILTGINIHTEGLSVRYPDLKDNKEKKLILLDSTGLQRPILSYDKKEIDANTRDKMITELFLQNLIINTSDILLIVVGELTYSEQLLINKIKEECKKENKGKIFIIHNLREYITKEQVEKYIKNSLSKCALFHQIKLDYNEENKIENENEEEKKENEIIEDNKSENENKIELEIPIKENNIIINEKDENNINPQPPQNENDKKDDKKEDNRINIIKTDDKDDNNKNDNDQKDVKNIDNKSEDNKDIKNEQKEKEVESNRLHFTEIEKFGDKKRLEIYHLIIANEDSEAGKYYNQYAYDFIENVYKLISEPKKFDVFEQIKDNFKLIATSILPDINKEYNFNNNEDILNEKKIKLDIKEDIKLGLPLTAPKYSYFKPDEKTLEIRIELPGKIQLNLTHKVVGDETIVSIKGEKLKDKKPDKIEDNVVNLREYGEFEINIPLKVQEFKIISAKPKEGFPKFVNGICIIQFDVASKVEEEKAEVDAEDL